MKTIKEILSGSTPQSFFTSGEFKMDPRFLIFIDMVNIPQPIRYHPEGDVLNHIVEVLTILAASTDHFQARLAGMLHDIGKILTPKEIYPRHFNHDNTEAETLARTFLAQFPEVTATTINFVAATIHYHMAAKTFHEFKGAARRRMLRKLGSENLEDFCFVLMADHTAKEEVEEIRLFGKTNNL
jgi:tRNA nucleotidyltransferase (CCA-adding enzyme)